MSLLLEAFALWLSFAKINFAHAQQHPQERTPIASGSEILLPTSILPTTTSYDLSISSVQSASLIAPPGTTGVSICC